MNAMIGINVRNTAIPFADLIVDGIKTIETRESRSLHPYIDKNVAIVRTGKGKAFAIGQVKIVGCSLITDHMAFDDLYEKHFVAKHSIFYIKDAKYMYHLSDALRYETPRLVANGIVSRKVFNHS
jgi:predicted transcriptional regulator